MIRDADKLTTNEVIEKLGVSRQWINMYLREMGEIDFIKNDSKIPKRVVLYSKKELIEWLNEHAICSCQVGWIDLSRFIPIREIKAINKAISNVVKRLEEESQRENDKQKAVDAKLAAINMWSKFLEEKLPNEIYESHIKSASIRSRGKIEHVAIDYKIDKLDELMSMNALKLAYGAKSNEIVYRELFSKGAIKVQICGRTWYAMPPKNDFEYAIKVEYSMKQKIESDLKKNKKSS